MSAIRNGAADAGLPLAASCRREDPHYDPYIHRRRIDVFLDGALVPRVVSYDVGAGEIVRHVRDQQGRAAFLNGGFVFETLRGCVEVRFAGRRLLPLATLANERVSS